MMQRERANPAQEPEPNDHGYSEGIGFFGRVFPGNRLRKDGMGCAPAFRTS